MVLRVLEFVEPFGHGSNYLLDSGVLLTPGVSPEFDAGVGVGIALVVDEFLLRNFGWRSLLLTVLGGAACGDRSSLVLVLTLVGL